MGMGMQLISAHLPETCRTECIAESIGFVRKEIFSLTCMCCDGERRGEKM
jgi:hypothetical protein